MKKLNEIAKEYIKASKSKEEEVCPCGVEGCPGCTEGEKEDMEEGEEEEESGKKGPTIVISIGAARKAS